MSLKTKTIGVAGVVTLIGVIAINSMDFPMLNPSRRHPAVQRTAGDRLYVKATLSTVDEAISLRAGSSVGGGKTTVEAVSVPNGWDGQRGAVEADGKQAPDTTYKQFGPFPRGVRFTVIVDANELKWVQCALQTVGRPQIPRPPQQVASARGKVTCSLTVGE